MKGIRKRGNNWYIDYRCNGKRYIRRIGHNKKVAIQARNKVLTEIAENKFLDKQTISPLLFKDFTEDYINKYSKVNKRSWKDDVSRLGKLNDLFGDKTLHEITPEMIEDFKCKALETLSRATVNRYLACMKHLYTVAIQWKRVDKNPVREVKLFKENNNRLRYLEYSEAERLVECCKGYLRDIVVVALNTGMRQGEIFNLKWSDIDFDRKIIHLQTTKNGESRKIAMNQQTHAVLSSVNRDEAASYAFHNNGKPFTNVKRSFATALRRAGISDFRFHDLRHTFASHLAMAGVDLNTIRELMGHKSIRMTLRYAHLNQEHKQQAVDVLNTKWLQNGNKQEKEETAEKVGSLKLFKNIDLRKPIYDSTG